MNTSFHKCSLTSIVKIIVNKKPYTFLIDAGASISIIKPHVLRKDQIQPSRSIEITGVNGGSSFTNGLYKSLSNFKFHVANVNIKQDGKLGYD